MDKQNQPAPDRPEETGETLDPNAIWSPQPSAVYGLQDSAAAEGARKPDAILEADRLMEERQDTTGGCEAQGRPFAIADHEIQHTNGGVKTDLEFDIALRSGEGQSGLPGDSLPPLVMPNVAKPTPPTREGT